MSKLGQDTVLNNTMVCKMTETSLGVETFLGAVEMQKNIV